MDFMTKFKKVLLILLSLVFFLASCNTTPSGKNISYSIDGSANNLDPQTAGTKNEFFILENTMEGLMSVDESGNIIFGLANDYKISEDSLVYTFTLRDDIFWVDYKNKKANKITSKDFSFAFLRLFSSKENLINNKDFFVIENSVNYLNGAADFDSLGIKTPDEKTIVFTLENPSKNFLKNLSSPPSFPCNEEYFNETEGRYGLTYRHLLYSGPFFVSSWAKEDYFTLRKNNEYYDEDNVLTERIVVSVIDDKTTSLIDEFLKDKNDIVTVFGQEITLLDENEISYTQSTDSSLLLIFNNKKPLLQNKNIRDGLKYSVKYGFDNTNMPLWFESTRGIIPLDTKINNGPLFTDFIDYNFSNLYNKELSVTAFEDGLNQLGLTSLPPLKIVYEKDDHLTSLLQQVQRSFQEDLSVFIDIVPLEKEKLDTAFKDLDFDIILYNIIGDQSSPYQILSELSIFYDENIEYNNVLKQASDTVDEKKAAQMFFSAEQMIIDESIVYPILQQKSFRVSKKSLENIIYSPHSKEVLFKYAFKN